MIKYHVAVENSTLDYHWTEKIADSIMSLCLTFYSGDPKLEQVLPPESFIRIPIDDPPRALAIIQQAIADNSYEKRLPAIFEVRRLLVCFIERGVLPQKTGPEKFAVAELCFVGIEQFFCCLLLIFGWHVNMLRTFPPRHYV